MRARGLITITLLTTCSHAQVVDKKKPILVQSPLEHREHELLEIFRTIGRAKRQAPRQPASTRRQHCHLLLGVWLIINLVEPFLEVAH